MSSSSSLLTASNEELHRLLSNFQVLNADGSKKPLDVWAQWLIKLGFNFSQFHNYFRNVICISVPDRGFATAFLALGAVLGCATKSFTESSDHENRIKKFKVGDLVSMPDTHGHLRSAKLYEINDTTISYFRQGEGHKTTRPITHCQDVWPLIGGEKLFRTSSHSIKTTFPISYGVFSGARKIIELRSSNNVVVVGIETLLLDELNNLSINLEGKNLASLIKPFGFVGVAERSQSVIIPSVSASIPDTVPMKQNFLIFDGASSFMNLYNRLDALNTVIVLNRRAQRSADAAALVRQLRSQWIGFGDPFRSKSVPESIEFLSWSLEND